MLLFYTAFLHVFCHKLTFHQLGGLAHSVIDTFVQLTEGRSARDQPKQPPAKKNSSLKLERDVKRIAMTRRLHRGVNVIPLASVTGLEVLVVRIPYRSGFRPTGPQWCYNSCSRRRITIVQTTRLGWTRRRHRFGETRKEAPTPEPVCNRL